MVGQAQMERAFDRDEPGADRDGQDDLPLTRTVHATE
jgi:hypothetical protein